MLSCNIGNYLIKCQSERFIIINNNNNSKNNKIQMITAMILQIIKKYS